MPNDKKFITVSRTGIYTIRSKQTGRIYVGSAIHFTGRRNLHLSQLRRGIHHSIKLQRHFDKYGDADLEFELIEQVLNQTDLIVREQFYLDILHPFFNTCKKADSRLGIPHSAKTIEKMRKQKNKLGKRLSDEQKENCRKAQIKRFEKPSEREAASRRIKGKTSPNKGIKMTPERIAKSSGENHGMHKLTDSQVIEIRRLYQPAQHQRQQREYSSRKLGKMFGVSGAQIRRIINYQDRKNIIQ